jgi:anti-sigma regulatory factor (Ser/Thr protein kinase)
LRELLLNAVESGGQLDPTQRVRVLRRRARGVLVYRIAHMEVRGREGTRAGGLGLMRVKAIADERIYNARGNEVTFVKYLAEPSGH